MDLNVLSLSTILGTDQGEFTDAHLVELSMNIIDSTMLRNLAVVGFKMKRAIVESRLHNNRDFTDAAYEVLKEWRNSQETPTEAYTNMCRALRRAGIQYLIGDVLQQQDAVS